MSSDRKPHDFKTLLKSIDDIFVNNYKNIKGLDIDPSKLSYKEIHNNYGEYYKEILQLSGELSECFKGAYFQNMELVLRDIKTNVKLSMKYLNVIIGSYVMNRLRDYPIRVAEKRGTSLCVRLTDNPKDYKDAEKLSRFLAYYDRAFIMLAESALSDGKIYPVNNNRSVKGAIRMKTKIDPKKGDHPNNLKEMDNWIFKIRIPTKREGENGPEYLSPTFKLKMMDQVEVTRNHEGKIVPKRNLDNSLIYKQPVRHKGEPLSINNIHELITKGSGFMAILKLNTFSISMLGINLKCITEDITVKKGALSEDLLSLMGVDEMSEYGMDIEMEFEEDSIDEQSNTDNKMILPKPISNNGSMESLLPPTNFASLNISSSATPPIPETIIIPKGNVVNTAQVQSQQPPV